MSAVRFRDTRGNRASLHSESLNPLERLGVGISAGGVCTLLAAPFVAVIADADKAFRDDRPFMTYQQANSGVLQNARGLWDLPRRYLRPAEWNRDPRGQQAATEARQAMKASLTATLPRRVTGTAAILFCRDTLHGWTAPLAASSGMGLGSMLTSVVIPLAVNTVVGGAAAFVALAVTTPMHYDPLATTEIMHFYVKQGKPEMSGTPSEVFSRLYGGFAARAPLFVVSTAITFGLYDTTMFELKRKWAVFRDQPWLASVSLAWLCAIPGRLIGEATAEASVMASADAHADQFPGSSAYQKMKTTNTMRHRALRMGVPGDAMARLPTVAVRMLPPALAIGTFDWAKAAILRRRRGGDTVHHHDG
jgi:hypothetical protein